MVATPAASPSAGTYTSVQNVSLSCTTSGANIYYTTNGNTPTTGSTLYSGPITIGSTTTLKAIAVKAGMVDSDVLTSAYTINLPLDVVATPTANPGAGSYTSVQSVVLTSATSGASIYYTTNGSTPTTSSTQYTGAIPISTTTTLKAIATKSGMTNSSVLTATYTINLTPVATPIASPGTGTYTSVQNVSLSCATSGASIHYTTDGSNPTSSSTLYSGSITIGATTTLKAIAVNAGMTNSNVLTAVYTINLTPVATPTANPSAGTYSSAQTVTLNCATGGATIHYTTNGNTPTTSSSQYSSAITINANTTLKAIAVKADTLDSGIMTAVYNIKAATPTASPGTGTYTSVQNVSLSCATSGASIRYTTDGSTPTSSSTLYSGSITIAATTTLKAIAIKSDMTNSDVLTATYTINLPTVSTWKGLSVPSATTALQHNSFQGKTDVLQVNPASTSSGYDWQVLSYDLSSYAGKEITIDISMDVWLSDTTKFAWQVNNTGYPVICGSTSTTLSAGQWHTITNSSNPAIITPEVDKSLYLSKDQLVGNPVSVGTPAGNVELYITGFTITITETVVTPPGGTVTTPTDSRILNPAAATQLSGYSLTVNKPHGGGNKPLTGSPYGYETWDEDTSGDAVFYWYGPSQGGGGAFRAEFGGPNLSNRPKDFLARVGYFWNTGNPYTSYENIYCGFNFTRSGQYRGNFSYIGIYGWSKNPTVEYYIVEDTFGNAWRSETSYIQNIQETIQGTEVGSYTLDGGTYKVYRKERTGPSIEGTNTNFTQFFSVRQTPRQSGTISVTEHFKKWAGYGMNLGSNMYECKFKVEVGGTETSGSAATSGWFDAKLIQFYRASDNGNILQITP